MARVPYPAWGVVSEREVRRVRTGWEWGQGAFEVGMTVSAGLRGLRRDKGRQSQRDNLGVKGMSGGLVVVRKVVGGSKDAQGLDNLLTARPPTHPTPHLPTCPPNPTSQTTHPPN